MSLQLVPGLPLREANAFVRAHHRHHKKDRGCFFAVGVAHLKRVPWPEWVRARFQPAGLGDRTGAQLELLNARGACETTAHAGLRVAERRIGG